MSEPQPIEVYDEIKDGYLRYYDTAFRLADPKLLESNEVTRYGDRGHP